MSAAPQTSASSMHLASDATTPAAGFASNPSSVWPPSPCAIDMAHATASPESMSVAIQSQLSELTAERVRLGGLRDDPLIAALVRDRIAFLESTLRSLRGWSSLYSDALRTIFQFASLDELSRLMCVSRRWGEAVTMMPSLAIPVNILDDAFLARVLNSQLCRHVGSLRTHLWGRPGLCQLTPQQFQLASVQSPWFSELSVVVSGLSFVESQSVCSALARFRHLRRLELVLPSDMQAAQCNLIIEAIGALNPATINTLKLNLPTLSDVSFAPLAVLTRMRELDIFLSELTQVMPALTDAQCTELRSLSSVEKLTMPFEGQDETDFLVHMLQPGHSLGWTTLGAASRVDVTAPLAAVLGSLPSLTSLSAFLHCVDDLLFLPQLVHLNRIDLGNFGEEDDDSAALVQSLRFCTALTHLTLRNFDLSGSHLVELLPHFPLLSSVKFACLRQMESLRCFASPALAATLTELHLTQLPRCSPSELTHLFGLKSLRSLHIETLKRRVTFDQKSPFQLGDRFPALLNCVVD